MYKCIYGVCNLASWQHQKLARALIGVWFLAEQHGASGQTFESNRQTPVH